MTWKDIPGWFDFQDVYDEAAASAGPRGFLVEVGCAFGRSTAYLGALCATRGAKVLAVDSWCAWPPDSQQVFLENMHQCGLLGTVVPVCMDSTKAAAALCPGASFPFVFIDADHAYESARDDIAAWLPRVRPGGVLAGHDYCADWPGVIRAVDEAFGVGAVEVLGNSWRYRKP